MRIHLARRAMSALCLAHSSAHLAMNLMLDMPKAEDGADALDEMRDNCFAETDLLRSELTRLCDWLRNLQATVDPTVSPTQEAVHG